MQETHTITVLVENKPGVLARVSGLFARRGYNIESLTVSITDDPNVSRMTIVVAGDHYVVASHREVRDSRRHLRNRYELRHVKTGEIIRGLRNYNPAQPPSFPSR